MCVESRNYRVHRLEVQLRSMYGPCGSYTNTKAPTMAAKGRPQAISRPNQPSQHRKRELRVGSDVSWLRWDVYTSTDRLLRFQILRRYMWTKKYAASRRSLVRDPTGKARSSQLKGRAATVICDKGAIWISDRHPPGGAVREDIGNSSPLPGISWVS